MDRTSWILASALAIPLMAAAGCKDSNPNYISFDASSSDSSTGDAKRDGAADAAPGTDATPADTGHSEASTDAPAGDTLAASDGAADATGADDTSSDVAPDTEPGQ